MNDPTNTSGSARGQTELSQNPQAQNRERQLERPKKNMLRAHACIDACMPRTCVAAPARPPPLRYCSNIMYQEPRHAAPTSLGTGRTKKCKNPTVCPNPVLQCTIRERVLRIRTATARQYEYSMLLKELGTYQVRRTSSERAEQRREGDSRHVRTQSDSCGLDAGLDSYEFPIPRGGYILRATYQLA